VIDNNGMAVADPIGYLWCAMACAGAICAWKNDSYGWLFVCLLGAILSIYTKYWTLYPLLLWGIVAFWLLMKHRRRALLPLSLQLVFGIAAAGGLLLYLSQAGLSSISPEMTDFTESGANQLLDWGRHLNNLSYFPQPIGEPLFWGVLLAGAAGFIASRSRNLRAIDLRWVIILSVTTILAVLPVSTFIYISSLKYVRHALPVTIVLIGLWSMAVTQIIWTVSDFLRGKFLPAAAASIIGAAVIVPYSIGNLNLIQQYSLTPIQVDLWRYTESSVPVDGMILMDSRSLVEDTWNRAWSGYDGSKSFEWWLEDAEVFTQTPVENYVERGIIYFAMSDEDIKRVYGARGIDPSEFLDQLTLLKRIHAAPDRLGQPVAFYRLNPPTYSTGYVYGGQIQLLGYDLSADTVEAGETVTLRPYWKTLRTPDSNYSMFVHLYPRCGKIADAVGWRASFNRTTNLNMGRYGRTVDRYGRNTHHSERSGSRRIPNSDRSV
jgi:hypothetical protein